jgi:hypothetical protein
MLGFGISTLHAEHVTPSTDPISLARNPLDNDEYLIQVIKEARKLQRENPLDLLDMQNEEEMLTELNDALKNIAQFINTPEALEITQNIYREMSVALEKIKEIQEKTGVVTLDQVLEKANSYKNVPSPAHTEQSDQPLMAP